MNALSAAYAISFRQGLVALAAEVGCSLPALVEPAPPAKNPRSSGRSMSAETKAKLRTAAQERMKSPEARARVGAATAQRLQDPAYRARLSAALRDYVARNPDARARLVAAGKTDQSRLRKAAAARHWWATATPEQRAERLRPAIAGLARCAAAKPPAIRDEEKLRAAHRARQKRYRERLKERRAATATSASR